MFNKTALKLFLGLNHVKANLGWKDGTWQGWNNELLVDMAESLLDDLQGLGVLWDDADLGLASDDDTPMDRVIAQGLVNEAYKSDQFQELEAWHKAFGNPDEKRYAVATQSKGGTTFYRGWNPETGYVNGCNQKQSVKASDLVKVIDHALTENYPQDLKFDNKTGGMIFYIGGM